MPMTTSLGGPMLVPLEKMIEEIAATALHIQIKWTFRSKTKLHLTRFRYQLLAVSMRYVPVAVLLQCMTPLLAQGGHPAGSTDVHFRG